MKVEWDAAKAESNRRKHGVEFEEAVSCLFDPRAITMEDESAEFESRWVLMGLSFRVRLLTVVYTVRAEDKLRLISARKATRREAESYA
jgi:uncharacterized DUF497 family protein